MEAFGPETVQIVIEARWCQNARLQSHVVFLGIPAQRGGSRGGLGPDTSADFHCKRTGAKMQGCKSHVFFQGSQPGGGVAQVIGPQKRLSSLDDPDTPNVPEGTVADIVDISCW